MTNEPEALAPKVPRRDQVLVNLDPATRAAFERFLVAMSAKGSGYYGKVNFTAAVNKLIQERLAQLEPVKWVASLPESEGASPAPEEKAP